MNRRNLLKNLGLGAASLVTIPTWAEGWNTASLPLTQALPVADEALLKELVDALIPKSDTPGALELGVDQFIKAMVESQHTETDQQAFYSQLSETDALAQQKYNKKFAPLSAVEKNDLLQTMATSNNYSWKKFFGLLKNYTIQGYTGSEWYMTNIAGYEYAPGYGHGCVDV